MKAASKMYYCGKCCSYFEQYLTLVEHLYWRHGTEGNLCPVCPVKWWDFAAHRCFLLPQVVNASEEESDDSDSDESGARHTLDSDTIVMEAANIVESGYDSAYQAQEPSRDSPFCVCGKVIPDSKMIGCDGRECPYEWYHYQCVGIVEAPEGDWLCHLCRRH